MNALTHNFGREISNQKSLDKTVLGNKGANLAQMCIMGLPVPPGFTLSVDLCRYYYTNEKELPKSLEQEVKNALAKVEEIIGKKFGDKRDPLLVSVRSGSCVSMPGMMETILNLGLNDATVVGLAEVSSDEKFAYDSYRRFIQMYAQVVLGLDNQMFVDCFDSKQEFISMQGGKDFEIQDYKDLVREFKKLVLQSHGQEFPQDPYTQLMNAIRAVLDSWMCNRAMIYRSLNAIPADLGTAITIQSMVFGNMGSTSATGVAFTRNPSNGENTVYGEFLLDAQGEDIVAGTKTPHPLNMDVKEQTQSDHQSLQELMPDIYEELFGIMKKLELHYRDMQDIEFTIQQGKLWMLQTRSGKRTPNAAVRIAYDMVGENLITKQQALLSINPHILDQLLHPTLDPKAKKNLFAKGLPASPGAASGTVVFSSEEAQKLSIMGHKVILVRTETSPEDIGGMYAAQGILTARGGMTSHAAVVARGMGKTCVAGAKKITIDYAAGKMTADGKEIKRGEHITIEGGLGEVLIGEMPTVSAGVSKYFKALMSWSDEFKSLEIRANAETPEDVKTSIDFGAVGIGLCRTEHMFFSKDRINIVRRMIVSKTTEERNQALKEIMPFQKSDFIQIFGMLCGKVANIRLLDMPLHEFLPNTKAELDELSAISRIDADEVATRVKELQEVNPMLGHRGSRLGITYPEIYLMQVKAICEAMVEVDAVNDFEVKAEIMVPLIATPKEMKALREMVEGEVKKAEATHSVKLNYKIGTMIELPRAAICSDQIANYSDYMSYGTNDLSQTTFGLSRDDAGSFIQDYIDKGILSVDPFIELDQEGVGELIKLSVERAKATNPLMKFGICGEHGGDPKSIEFFHKVNLDYVSCSPYRIPIARLAAAQAAIKSHSKKS